MISLLSISQIGSNKLRVLIAHYTLSGVKKILLKRKEKGKCFAQISADDFEGFCKMGFCCFI